MAGRRHLTLFHLRSIARTLVHRIFAGGPNKWIWHFVRVQRQPQFSTERFQYWPGHAIHVQWTEYRKWDRMSELHFVGQAGHTDSIEF